jgi:hypothetical protein
MGACEAAVIEAGDASASGDAAMLGAGEAAGAPAARKLI